MYRLAVCLLFITIFQNGILQSLQDDPTTPAAENLNSIEKLNSNSSETPTKENDTESENKADDVSSNPEAVTEKITPIRTHEPTTTEEVHQSTTRRPKPTVTSEPDLSSKIMGPVLQVRARIGEAVSKGVDGAKDIADGAYNFFKEAVTSLF